MGAVVNNRNRGAAQARKRSTLLGRHRLGAGVALPKVRVGCSGWSYDDWRGVFYPRDAPPGEWLERYARVFDTVEVDSTYYALPSRETVARWARVTPPGFLFLPKLPGAITHERSLRGTEALLDEFIERVVPLRLAGKLGPVLAQFPASFVPEKDQEALAGWVARLPSDLKWAVELRSAKWWRTPIADVLREHGVALAWSVNQHAPVHDVETAPFLYARFIGDRELTRFSHIQRDLSAHIVWMKERLERAERVNEAYALVNNHFMGYGPGTSQLVQELLGLPVSDAALAMRPARQRGLGDFA